MGRTEGLKQEYLKTKITPALKNANILFLKRGQNIFCSDHNLFSALKIDPCQTKKFLWICVAFK